MAANGDLWITTFMSGGLHVIAGDGSPVRFVETDGVQCNCVFDAGWLYLTDFGDLTEATAEAPMVGRLSRVRVDVEGMPLFRGAVTSA